MGYQVYRVRKDDGDYRFGGYGIPATCEYPRCRKEIDRGMSYACGGEPFSEYGCDRYFCSKHRRYVGFSDGEICKCKNLCECEVRSVCERCAKGDSPFPYKKEHVTWARHVLKDESWSKWRKDNPEKVKELRLVLKKK